MKLGDYLEKLERLSNLADSVSIISLIDNLKEIKESQKVIVPQFVADWYEECKDDFETSLFQCIYEL